MKLYCRHCGEEISPERMAIAKTRGKQPLYDTNKCRELAAAKRFRQRQKIK